MTSGRTSTLTVVGLAVAISLLARDLALPLLIISMFGLFDRLVGDPVLRARTRL